MRAQSLGDLAGGVVFESESRSFCRLSGFLIRVFVRFLNLLTSQGLTIRWSRGQRPQPHSRQPSVLFETGSVRALENHRDRFFRHGSPDIFQIFLQSDFSPLGFSTREYREKISRAGPRQAKMASAPTTPSSAAGASSHGCGCGNSAKTSRQSPMSSVRIESSSFLRGRQTRWTEDASRACPCAAMRASISVSIGHEPVIIQPASTTAFKMASQLAVVLLAKTMVPIPSGRSTRLASPNALVNSLS